MNLDFALYLIILDPVQCGGHARALDVTRAALDGGVTIVQLRVPEWHKRAWLNLALDLLPLTRWHGVPLIINDHVDVALAAGADGVHIGQKNLPPDVARTLFGARALIGLSVSNDTQIEHANTLGGTIDYVGVGPVFDTPQAGCVGGGRYRRARCSMHPTVAYRRNPAAQRRRCQTCGAWRYRGGIGDLHRCRPASRRTKIA